MNPIKFLLALLLMNFMSSLAFATEAVSITMPLFEPSKGQRNPEVRMKGQLVWSKGPCFETSPSDWQLKKFPIFSYRRLIPKDSNDFEGSYCGHLRLPASAVGKMYNFNMIRVFGNAELYVNGLTIWQQDEKTGPIKLNVNHLIEKREIAIEIRLACNDSPLCGFRGSLHILEANASLRADNVRSAFDLLAFCGLGYCLFYHLFFTVLRRQSGAALFLTTNCIALLLRLPLTGQSQLHYILNISESAYWRLELLSIMILLPSSLSIVKTTFQEQSPVKAANFGWALLGLACLGIAFLSSEYFLPILLLAYVLIFVNIYVFSVTGWRAVKAKRSGTINFIVCSTVVVITTFLEVLNTRLNVEMSSLVQPLGYMCATIMQSVLLATRINDALILAETQEREKHSLKIGLEEEIVTLDKRIIERTIEMRTIIESISTGIICINRGENGSLAVSSEYSDYLRHVVGFDIESWHELHFFLRRLSIKTPTASSRQLGPWMEAQMQDPTALTGIFDGMLSGIVFFNDVDTQKYLKFKWSGLYKGGHYEELFIYVFDVSRSIELEHIARHKRDELLALEELVLQDLCGALEFRRRKQ